LNEQLQMRWSFLAKGMLNKKLRWGGS